jgi:hypothetical protein
MQRSDTSNVRHSGAAIAVLGMIRELAGSDLATLRGVRESLYASHTVCNTLARDRC